MWYLDNALECKVLNGIFKLKNVALKIFNLLKMQQSFVIVIKNLINADTEWSINARSNKLKEKYVEVNSAMIFKESESDKEKYEK